MRQRSSASGTSPISSTGAVAARSPGVTAFSPPSNQKVMDGSCVVGSARILMSEMPAPSSAPTAMPASTSTSTGSCRRTSPATPTTAPTASSPPPKASACTAGSGRPR